MNRKDASSHCARSLSEGPSNGEGAPDPAGGAAAPAGSNSSPTPFGSHQGERAPADPPTPPGARHTFAGVPVTAMEDVMAMRAQQIHEFGHTPQKDREAPLWSPREFGPNGRRSLLRQITRQLGAASEYAAFGPAKLEIVRRNLVRTAALILAAIDWIDAEQAERKRPLDEGEDDA